MADSSRLKIFVYLLVIILIPITWLKLVTYYMSYPDENWSINNIIFSEDNQHLIIAAKKHAIPYSTYVGGTFGTLGDWVASLAFGNEEIFTYFHGRDLGDYLVYWNFAAKKTDNNIDTNFRKLLINDISPDMQWYVWTYPWADYDVGSYRAKNEQCPIKLWDTKGEQPEIDLWQDYVSVLDFSTDSKFLASGGYDQRIVIWDLSTFEKQEVIDCQGRYCFDIEFSPDGKYIASIEGNRQSIQEGKMTIGNKWFTDAWIRETSNPLKAIKIPLTNAATALSYSPDGKILAIGRWNNDLISSDIVLWDLKSNSEVMALPGLSDPIERIVYSPDGKNIVFSDDNFIGSIESRRTQAVLIDLETAKKDIVFNDFYTKNTDYPRELKYSSDGQKLATIIYDSNACVIYNINNKSYSQVFIPRTSGHKTLVQGAWFLIAMGLLILPSLLFAVVERITKSSASH